jgi:type I restriction enzyme R subunit
LAEMVMQKEDPTSNYPASIKWSQARKALYDNLWQDEDLAITLDQKIREVKPHDWRNQRAKSMIVFNTILELLDDNEELTEQIFKIVKEQNEY